MKTVTLPEGRWRYFFNDQEVIDGPITFRREFSLDEYPVYVREGSIIPMNICREYTDIGDRGSEGYLTLLIYPYRANSFVVTHPDQRSTEIFAEQTEKKSG